jgi:hypothetical protein
METFCGWDNPGADFAKNYPEGKTQPVIAQESQFNFHSVRDVRKLTLDHLIKIGAEESKAAVTVNL